MTSYIGTVGSTNEANRHTQTVRCYKQSNAWLSGKKAF